MFSRAPAGEKIWDVMGLDSDRQVSFQKWLDSLFADILPFEDLKSLYGQLHVMNEFIVNRLRAACEKDSSINAVIILDSFTLLLPMEIDDSLKDLHVTFKPLVQALYDLEGFDSDE